MQVGKGHNASSLAGCCNVSKRTIFRDLDVLREAGLPLLYHEPDQRYYVQREYFLPPTNFTADEALALIVLCHELGGRDGVPYYEAARSAAVKLESTLPAGIREKLLDFASAVRIQMPPRASNDMNEPIYQQLLRAVAQRQAVRLTYNSLTEWETISTLVHPYRVLFSRRSWYVIGRSSLHRETRTFNLTRIEQLDMLEQSFEIPPRFNLERYLRNAWHLIPEPGPDSQVWVHFNKLVAQNVAEVLWHKTQDCSFRDDGSLDFRVTVSGLNEISWWILGYGDEAEVIEPVELREKVKQRIARMAQRYGVGEEAAKGNREIQGNGAAASETAHRPAVASKSKGKRKASGDPERERA